MSNVVSEKLAAAIAEYEPKLLAAANAAEVEEVRVAFFGRKGLLQAISGEMRGLDTAERPEAGKSLNAAKAKIESLIEEAKARLADGGAAKTERLDITLPGRRPGYGRKHPVSIVIDECVDIFRRMGFVVAAGPDIETVHHNFDALNTPKNHPSRDSLDTFYFADGRCMRTQTSPVQIRVMETHPPPVRIVAPGRCFRRDTPDATHSMNFHQIEGLYIDRQVSMADLKSVLLGFARELFGVDVGIRMRPHFFPFTEPSVEVDFSCIMCRGAGCRVCKRSGWLEIAGAGMVDPNVLSGVGLDPDEWSGYAFGMGVERLAMLRYRIDDIRLLYENDTRFLSQFVG